jgi:NAD(P)-dependent dehydrogenase (short-subunit alcohol dehydrogenase family)
MSQVALPKPPSFRLDGKRALITGAGRGIGLAGAAAMAEAGAHVTLVARTSAEIESLARAIEREGARAEAVTLDVTDIDRVEQALAALDPFDILVNSAGTNHPAPFLDVTAQQFDAIMGLNVRSLFFVSQAVGRGMRAAGRRGSIINISSQMGHVGAAIRTVYCGSKWAIEGMTKAMAIDLAPYGIRVNTIGPTFIETPLATRFLADAAFKGEVLAKIKLGRIGRVEDITGAIVFLASDASSLMTGSAVVIDGGWTADYTDGAKSYCLRTESRSSREPRLAAASARPRRDALLRKAPASRSSISTRERRPARRPTSARTISGSPATSATARAARRPWRRWSSGLAASTSWSTTRASASPTN